eukprot:13636073-Alexandrium_andersonii.AAC.1
MAFAIQVLVRVHARGCKLWCQYLCSVCSHSKVCAMLTHRVVCKWGDKHNMSKWCKRCERCNRCNRCKRFKQCKRFTVCKRCKWYNRCRPCSRRTSANDRSKYYRVVQGMQTMQPVTGMHTRGKVSDASDGSEHANSMHMNSTSDTCERYKRCE